MDAADDGSGGGLLATQLARGNGLPETGEVRLLLAIFDYALSDAVGKPRGEGHPEPDYQARRRQGNAQWWLVDDDRNVWGSATMVLEALGLDPEVIRTRLRNDWIDAGTLVPARAPIEWAEYDPDEHSQFCAYIAGGVRCRGAFLLPSGLCPHHDHRARTEAAPVSTPDPDPAPEPRQCSDPSCEVTKILARGMCGLHYSRWREANKKRRVRCDDCRKHVRDLAQHDCVPMVGDVPLGHGKRKYTGALGAVAAERDTLDERIAEARALIEEMETKRGKLDQVIALLQEVS